MKKQLLIFSLLLSTATFSSLSFGEWELRSKLNKNTELYWDPELVREHDGYRYYYDLTNYLVPDAVGARSYKDYIQVNCGTLGFKSLSLTRYKQAMGEGYGSTIRSYSPEDAFLYYNQPGSMGEAVVKKVCDLSI